MNSSDVGVVFVLTGSNIALQLFLTTSKSPYSLHKREKEVVKVLPRCLLSSEREESNQGGKGAMCLQRENLQRLG